MSIITPVYNTEEYLPQCIESVIAQRYENWEYVIVNNRSTDRSIEIAETYARKDPRIRVTTNEEFLGQIENYNHALRQMSPSSKYCKIVQADDWIFPDCLGEMVKVAQENHSVGIVGSYALVGASLYLHGLPFPSTLVPGSMVCRKFLLEGMYLFGTPTSLLFRSDLVRGRDPFFISADGYFEDADVCFDILKDHDFGFVHQVLTFTRRDNESILSSIRSFNPFLLMEVYFLERKRQGILSQEEYRRRSRQKTREYFMYLGESVLRRRGDKFWSYHEKGLQKIGWRLSRIKLAVYALLAFLDLALNPKSTIERLSRFYRRNGAGKR